MAAKRRTLGRRPFLWGVGAAVAASPLLTLSPLRADGRAPLKLIIMFSPNNWIDRPYWTPEGSGDAFALPERLPAMLQALEPHRDQLLMLGDLRDHGRDHGIYDDLGTNRGHASMGHFLTGQPNAVFENAAEQNDFWAGGESVDQLIARRLEEHALTLGVNVRGNTGMSRISYTAANAPVHPYEDPQDVFDDVFGGGHTVDELARQRAQRRSVLDVVAGRLSRLRDHYGGDAYARLDRHHTAVRELEERLAGAAATCDATGPTFTDYPTEIDAQMDLMVEALACGVTRVATLQCGNTGGAESYNGGLEWPSEGISFPTSQHVIVHDFDQDNAGADESQRMAIETMYTRKFARLLDKLGSVIDADGQPLLANCVVMYGKCMGWKHNEDRQLYILAGGGVGADRLGRFERHMETPHNDLLVSICRLMGLTDVERFGHPEMCTGDLLDV